MIEVKLPGLDSRDIDDVIDQADQSVAARATNAKVL